MRLGTILRAGRRMVGDDAGTSLPEVLVGLIIGALVMTAVTSAIFTSNDLRIRVDDRSQIAGDLSVLAVRFDRDVAMATAAASARSQTSATSCATSIDLGYPEAGGQVSFRTIAGSPGGPLWLQRVSGAGARTLARNVSSCTWQATADASGQRTIQMTIVFLAPSGESVSQVLRSAPRLW